MVVLSQLKFSILWMVINFFDVLIVDSDTVAFLLSIFPDLRIIVIVAVLIAAPLLMLLWRIDPFRVPRAISLLGATVVRRRHHRPVAGSAGGALGAVPGRQSHLDVRALRRDDGL